MKPTRGALDWLIDFYNYAKILKHAINDHLTSGLFSSGRPDKAASGRI